MGLVSLARWCGGSEGYVPVLKIARGHFPNADLCRGCRNRFGPGPSAPFLPIDPETGGINGIRPPLFGVGVLTVGKGFRGPRVAPAEVVPIIHMESNWNEVFPKAGRFFQPTQPGFRRRTTAAALRRVELDQRGLLPGALECEWGALSDYSCDKHRRQTQKHGAHCWHIPLRRGAGSSRLIYPVVSPSSARSDIRKRCSAVCSDDGVWRSRPRASDANTRRRLTTSQAAARESKSRGSPKVAATR